MNARPDDDALTWEGDDDPTLDVGAASPVTDGGAGGTDTLTGLSGTAAGPDAMLPEGYRAVGKGSDQVRSTSSGEPKATGDDRVEPVRTQFGNAALVGLGIMAGVYLLLTVGWLLGAGRLQLVAQLFLDPIAFQVTLWLAVAALPLWFLTVLLFTRRSATWMRFALLGAGAVLLIPWPFVLAGAAL